MAPPAQFDEARLSDFAFSLPTEITIQPIDFSLHSRGPVTAAELNIGHAFKSFEAFFSCGFGFAVLDGETAAALVSSYLVHYGESRSVHFYKVRIPSERSGSRAVCCISSRLCQAGTHTVLGMRRIWNPWG